MFDGLVDAVVEGGEGVFWCSKLSDVAVRVSKNQSFENGDLPVRVLTRRHEVHAIYIFTHGII